MSSQPRHKWTPEQMSTLEQMGITLSSWITERKNYHDLDSVTHVYICRIGNTILAMDRPLKEHAEIYCVCCGYQGFSPLSE